MYARYTRAGQKHCVKKLSVLDSSRFRSARQALFFYLEPYKKQNELTKADLAGVAYNALGEVAEKRQAISKTRGLFIFQRRVSFELKARRTLYNGDKSWAAR